MVCILRTTCRIRNKYSCKVTTENAHPFVSWIFFHSLLHLFLLFVATTYELVIGIM